EVGAGPEAFGSPVVALQLGELPAHVPAGDALQGVDQPGECHLGRVDDQEVHVVGFAVELHQFGLEVGAHVPADLLQSGQVRAGEYVVSILGDKNQVRMEVANHMSTSTNVHLCGHETKCSCGR